jgi:nucleotide-binding universal stress UspA family protein
MGHILVPTDFSANADHALYFATQLALIHSDQVTVMHAFKSKIDLLDSEFEPENPKSKMQELLKRFDQNVQGLIKDGDVLDSIAEMTGTGLYSLVVMGTKGASGFEEHLFGSVTARTIEKVEVPLLVVPDKANFKQPKKIGFAISFSTEDINAIEVLKNFTLAYAEKLMCFHVAFDASDKVEAEAKMAHIQENFWETPLDRLSFDVVVNDDIEEGISEFIKAHNLDIMAVMPLKKGFWDSIFRQSVSKNLAFHSRTPLLIVKA